MTELGTPRRVVHVLNSTETGGAEVVALHLGRAMRAFGWQPEILALRGEGPLSAAFHAAGIPVHDLRVPRDRGILTIRSATRAWLTSSPPAVVHTHNVSPLVAVALATRSRRTFRFVHTKHGRAGAANFRGRFLTRWAARRADAVVAVSDDARSWGIREEGYPARRMHRIYNGIEVAMPRVGPAPFPHRIVTVSRLEPIKTVGLLLEAVAILRDEGRPVELDVVGDGSERAKLETQRDALGLGAQVQFAGWQADVDPWLRRAACFVLASSAEGLPMTVLEAMARGLPVVASDVGGNPEVVRAGSTGTLVAHGDSRALAQAIAGVLDDPVVAAEMGRAGAERVAREFSLEGMAAAYHRLYLGA